MAALFTVTLTFMPNSRSLEVGPRSRQRTANDGPLVTVSVGKVIDALALRLALDERRFHAIAVLGVVAPLSLRPALFHLAFVAISAGESIDSDALGLAPGE